MIIGNLQVGDTVLVNKGDSSDGTKLRTIISESPTDCISKCYELSDKSLCWNDGANKLYSIRRKVMLK